VLDGDDGELMVRKRCMGVTRIEMVTPSIFVSHVDGRCLLSLESVRKGS
jgi:hypothetical protein